MRRHLLTFLSIVSLVLCIALCVLWMRSYLVTDHFGRAKISPQSDGVVEYRAGLFSADGRISLADGWAAWAGTEYIRIYGHPAISSDEFGWFSGRFDYYTGEKDGYFAFGFGRNHHGTPPTNASAIQQALFDPDNDFYYRIVSVPYWYVVLITALLPTCWLLIVANEDRRPRAMAIGLKAILFLLGTGIFVLAIHGLCLIPIFMFTACLYGYAALSSRAERRSAAGLCHQCGYDLRATPTRCPECGAIPATDNSQ